METPFTLIRDFIAYSDELHDRLWEHLPWVRHANTPRCEAWMNDFRMPYTYGQGKFARTYTPSPWHKSIETIRDHLWDAHGVRMDSCFINGYRDGHDSLGWHSDDSPEMDDGRHIVVVSLGAEREIWFRPKGAKGEATHRVSLPCGSALFMPPGFQDAWEHRIPKSSVHQCGPRISLTFRGLVQPAIVQVMKEAREHS